MIEREKRKIGEWTVSWLEVQGLAHEYLARCDSTSRIAKDSAPRDPPVKVYVSDYQEAGRGRGTNSWTSPEEGTALLTTWSLELNFTPQHLTAPLIGLALFSAVGETWPDYLWSIKPPNDLYLGPHKAGGLLIETLTFGSKHRILIGLGFNVIAAPEGLPEATFLEGAFGSEGLKISQSDWHQFMDAWFKYLQNILPHLSQSELNAGQAQLILKALKAHPIWGIQTVTVETSGNIVYQDHTKLWQDL